MREWRMGGWSTDHSQNANGITRLRVRQAWPKSEKVYHRCPRRSRSGRHCMDVTSLTGDGSSSPTTPVKRNAAKRSIICKVFIFKEAITSPKTFVLWGSWWKGCHHTGWSHTGRPGCLGIKSLSSAVHLNKEISICNQDKFCKTCKSASSYWCMFW